MRKGDIGDKMYISVKGRLGIFMSRKVDESKVPVAILPEMTAVGDRALRQDLDEKRSATVICIDEDETICLSLTKEDYQQLLGRQIIVAKGFRYTFLVKFLTEIFGEWSKAKILDINDKHV